MEIVPSAYADTDVFVTVDVFGTIRSRTELHLYNAESLKRKPSSNISPLTATAENC